MGNVEDSAALANSAIVIMAKAPVPGAIKGRLCPPLTEDMASEFYLCVLKDKIAQASSVPEVQVFVAHPDTFNPEQCRELAGDLPCVARRGSSIDESYALCAEEILSKGYSKVLLVESATPTLPAIYFVHALSLLHGNPDRVVVGPTTDGGCYLIGLSRHQPDLLQGIPWETSEALMHALSRASELDLPVGLLPSWYDIDSGLDLGRLLLEVRNPGSAATAPHTTEWLDRWQHERIEGAAV